MITEKINSYFTKYLALKMLFFFDESREYEEEVKDLELQDVCVEHFEDNGFGLKWKRPIRWMVYFILIAMIFLFNGKEQQFIYFQF